MEDRAQLGCSSFVSYTAAYYYVHPTLHPCAPNVDADGSPVQGAL
jgi:hypothetical protein